MRPDNLTSQYLFTEILVYFNLTVVSLLGCILVDYVSRFHFKAQLLHASFGATSDSQSI